MAFSNLEEFVGYSERLGAGVLIDYYRPRIYLFFDRTSALLALVAAIFAISLLQRHNELTAIMAAGVPARRVIRPLIIAAGLVALFGILNREICIPSVQEKLIRNAQDWLGDQPRPVHPRRDYRTDILLAGRQTLAAEQQILQPHFRLHRSIGSFTRQLVAEVAEYQPANGDRPAGYLLHNVMQPENIAALPSAYIDGKPVILTARDTAWLKPRQCFVVSGVDFSQLATGGALREFSSSAQLIRGLHQPSLDYGADVRVTIHSRIVQPLLDMTLLFLGLPIILARDSRNIFVAAGMCLIIVTIFFLVVLICHALGNNGYLLSPALAAWCPLLIFAPLARALAQPLLV